MRCMFVLLAACGSYTILPPTVATTTITGAPIDDVLYAIEVWTESYGQDFSNYSLEISFEPQQFLCGRVLTDGCHNSAPGVSYIRVTSADCIGDTALAHELGHAILVAHGKSADHNHADTEHWERVKVAERAVVAAMCN